MAGMPRHRQRTAPQDWTNLIAAQLDGVGALADTAYMSKKMKMSEDDMKKMKQECLKHGEHPAVGAHTLAFYLKKLEFLVLIYSVCLKAMKMNTKTRRANRNARSFNRKIAHKLQAKNKYLQGGKMPWLPLKNYVGGGTFREAKKTILKCAMAMKYAAFLGEDYVTGVRAEDALDLRRDVEPRPIAKRSDLKPNVAYLDQTLSYLGVDYPVMQFINMTLAVFPKAQTKGWGTVLSKLRAPTDAEKDEIRKGDYQYDLLPTLMGRYEEVFKTLPEGFGTRPAPKLKMPSTARVYDTLTIPEGQLYPNDDNYPTMVKL